MSKLFFLGAGKMATAIAGGLVRQGVFAAADLQAGDIDAAAAAAFTDVTGVAADTDIAGSFADAEAVLLAVKPQALASAVTPLRTLFAGKTVLSIVAGVPIASLCELTGAVRVVRIMPNTPALVGSGAAAFAPGPGALPADVELAKRIFSAVGIALQTEEKYLDAVTALSGSGPAYVFEFIQALAAGGVAEGLTWNTAVQLAAQTVLGSARMVLETGDHPEVLKDRVTSPGGTTIRGLEQLYSHAFSGAVISAVRAAAERSAELGKK